ncbi:hypothetical protein MT356_06025 [Rathayibacter festucae]|uniref:hypothetical protein n=1 Tax=Rathayibacter festucae TaxID=110937 RepID=UPI001FB41071|nr:hypothetical protein [Rathayibacter festucae]MCJ1699274.1 hypothetical protein [Rathayibacter festucae]
MAAERKVMLSCTLAQINSLELTKSRACQDRILCRDTALIWQALDAKDESID